MAHDKVITIPVSTQERCGFTDHAAPYSIEEARPFIGASGEIRVQPGVHFEGEDAQLLYDPAAQARGESLNERATWIMQRSHAGDIAIHGPAVVLVGIPMLAEP